MRLRLKNQLPVVNWFRRKLKDQRSRQQRLSIWIMMDLNLGYIAVPKAASSSIRNLIREREAERLFPGHSFTHKQLRTKVERHIRRSATPANAAAIAEQVRLFSFVRNPLTRLYSCYRDKVVNAASQQARCSLSPYGIHFEMTFNQFVQRIAEIPDAQADQHFRSQHTFLTHNDCVLVQFLGRFETFDAQWQQLTEQYDLPRPTRTRRVSGPPTTLHSLPLSRSALALAMARYEKDITMFGYADEIAGLRSDA